LRFSQLSAELTVLPNVGPLKRVAGGLLFY
jgi:hypothetical protein